MARVEAQIVPVLETFDLPDKISRTLLIHCSVLLDLLNNYNNTKVTLTRIFLNLDGVNNEWDDCFE